MPATIMAVEDNKVVRLLITRLLEREGHTVLEASNGTEALATLHPGVDVVITDLYMPGTDGLELIMALRDNPLYADTPIVLLTAETDQALLGAARELGASRVLGKPFDAASLREAMRGLDAETGHVPTVGHAANW